MMDRNGSTTFQTSFWRVFRWIGSYAFVTVAIICLLRPPSGATVDLAMFVVIAILVFVLGMPAAGLLVLAFATKLDATGLRGSDVYGLPAAIAWAEMSDARSFNFGGLRFLRIKSAAGSRPLWIPMFHRDQEGFVAALHAAAPPDNVARMYFERSRA